MKKTRSPVCADAQGRRQCGRDDPTSLCGSLHNIQNAYRITRAEERQIPAQPGWYRRIPHQIGDIRFQERQSGVITISCRRQIRGHTATQCRFQQRIKLPKPAQ